MNMLKERTYMAHYNPNITKSIWAILSPIGHDLPGIASFLHRFRLNKMFKRQILNTFLPIRFNICFGCSKEPSH